MFHRFLLPLVVPVLLGPAFAQERPKDDPTPLTETQRIVHVLSRFAFGPTPGLVEEVRKQGLEAWFDQQLAGEVQENAMLAAWLESKPSLALDDTAIYMQYVDPYRGKRDLDPKQIRERNRLQNLPQREVKEAVLFRAIFGSDQLRETACDFWRNHFNVEAKKGSVKYFLPTWERDVIRRNVLGSFGDLLSATARHPAMLVYLDNYLSRKPPSDQQLKEIARNVRRKTKSREKGEEAADVARQNGLNENYARELLELHTLGVDNHYRQADVIEVAKALTGWGISTDVDRGVGFAFHANMHEDGDKTFLRRRIPEDRKDPISEGEAVLERLAEHSGTANYIAWKLSRYYVDDDPAPDTVRRVAAEWKRSKGDLARVYKAIFDAPEFFDPHSFQSKFKRPFEFLVSVVRVTQAEVSRADGLINALSSMSESLYECEDPTGYYDQGEAWNDPGVMALRWKFAMDYVRGRIPGVRVPRSFYADLHPELPQAWKTQLAERILPAGLSERSSEAMDAKIKEILADKPKPRIEELAPLILGMLLGSPEFQRQ